MRAILPLTALAASILCASVAHAQDTTALQECVTHVQTDNRLTDERLRRLRPGELLQAFGFPHALAGADGNITGFCARLLPLDAAAKENAASVSNAESARTVAESRADAAEGALRTAEGSWFRRFYALGWLLAIATLSWAIFSRLFRVLREMKRRRASNHATKHVVDVGFLNHH